MVRNGNGTKWLWYEMTSFGKNLVDIPVNPRNNENVDSFSFNTFHNKLA